jgi:ABC-type transport system substrate-binding protein
MQAGQFQMSIRGFGGTPLGYRNLAQLQGTQTTLVNPSRFRLVEYDRLYEQMLYEPDVEKQTVLSRRMSELAHIYVPFIPHVVELDNNFVQPWLLGFYPNDFTSYWKYLDIDLEKKQRGAVASSREQK